MGIHLSPAQLNRINDREDQQWSLVDLPEGPQPVPRWALGLSINWMEGYGNPPDMCLKTNAELRQWDEKRFQKDGSRYMAPIF